MRRAGLAAALLLAGVDALPSAARDELLAVLCSNPAWAATATRTDQLLGPAVLSRCMPACVWTARVCIWWSLRIKPALAGGLQIVS